MLYNKRSVSLHKLWWKEFVWDPLSFWQMELNQIVGEKHDKKNLECGTGAHNIKYTHVHIWEHKKNAIVDILKKNVSKITIYAQSRRKQKLKNKKFLTSVVTKTEADNGMVKNLRYTQINGSLLNLCAGQNSLVDSLARQNYK